MKPRNGLRLAMTEHEMVNSVVGELKAQVVGVTEKEKLLLSAELLRTSSDELREGIKMFNAVADVGTSSGSGPNGNRTGTSP